MKTIKIGNDTRIKLDNPELKEVASHVLNIAKISIEKAVAHYSDPDSYPINEDENSMEAIFLNSFKNIPEHQRQSTVEKVLSRINFNPELRIQELGQLSQINLTSPETVSIQADALVQRENFRLSPETIRNLEQVFVPLGENDLQPLAMPLDDLPKPEKLELRLHEVHCVDETNGFFGSESGEDEILLGGMAVDFKGDAKQIQQFKVYGYFDDGDKKTYSPPKVLTKFDLTSSNWPKAQSVTLILCEEDNGDFPDYLDSFFKLAKEKIKEGIGNIGFPGDNYVAKVAEWVAQKVFDYLKEIWENNIFKPITLTSNLLSLSSRFTRGTSTSPRISVDRKEFGGRYRLTYDWHLVWSKWKLIGGAASEIHASGDTIYATSPASGDIYRFEPETGNWGKIGGAGSEFAATNEDLFGLASDKSAVHRFTGDPSRWEKVGGPSKSILAGGNRLYAISPSGGDIYRYEGQPERWMKIGGPGRMFVANNTKLYGLSSDRSAIYEYDEASNKWTKVGGAAIHIYAGADELVATSPANGDLYRYKGLPGQWEAIGKGGLQFAITQQGIYGLATQRKGLYKYSGIPDKWDEIGGAYSSLCAGMKNLYALGIDTHEVWMLEG